MFRGLLCGLLSVLLMPLFGQDEVYPGDANANGIVDQYDIPYIGYAVGETGPARILTEDSQAQTVAQFWAEDFPSGPKFIHADGDGRVTRRRLQRAAPSRPDRLPTRTPADRSVPRISEGSAR